PAQRSVSWSGRSAADEQPDGLRTRAFCGGWLMSRRRRMLRPLVAGFVVVAVLVMTSLTAGAVGITSFTGLLGAAQGTGWAAHPDQTAGGTEQFVTGPATPPAGTGSLAMTVAANTDRALIFTVPKGGSAGPNDIGVASPWTTLTGSFSTFTAN